MAALLPGNDRLAAPQSDAGEQLPVAVVEFFPTPGLDSLPAYPHRWRSSFGPDALDRLLAHHRLRC